VKPSTDPPAKLSIDEPEFSMSSLWTELLYLHGYITDPKLGRRLMDGPDAPQRDRVDCAQASPASKAKPTSWCARLCLGIGDGCLHTQ
jgi:hypothetical protein